LPRFVFTVNTTPTQGTLGSNAMSATAITTDSGGNVYLAGAVSDSPFTATPGVLQSQSAGGSCATGSSGIAPPLPIPCANAFVIKLDPTGVVIFATYLGGTGNAKPSAISVDAQQNVYVAGTVTQVDDLPARTPTGFPVTSGAAFTSAHGTAGFVSKLNASGTQLEYSTLIPGASLAGIVLDGAGNLYFTGLWLNDGRTQFPATPGAFQSATPATQAAIVGELNTIGSSLVYGTYLSGTRLGSEGAAIAVDSVGNVLVAGTDLDPDFPATTGTFNTTYLSDQNVFLAKVNSGGTKLIYASLLGPATARNMKIAASGDIYIGVESYSNFPVTSAGFGQVASGGVYSDFLLKVSVDGSTVLNSIALPFSGVLDTWGMDLDSAGDVYVAGSVQNGALAASVGALQPAFGGGGADALIAKISPDGLVAGATYFGGSGADGANVIAAQRDGSVVVAGVTSSADLAGVTTSGHAGASMFFAVNVFPAITVENSASFAANTAVPGALVSIQGYGIGPLEGVSSAPAATLGSVQVYFDSFVAPITYAQGSQLNVQVPWEVAGESSTELTIMYNGVQVGGTVAPVVAAQPGVFYINNSDGSRNSPSNPARPGDFVALYGTGGGAMSPLGVTGNSWVLAPLSFLTQHVSVTVGGEAGAVLYAGSAPTLDSGFFQLNVRLPADLKSGVQFLSVTIGDATGAPVTLSVQ
jgi:uncharacterized protein (TIGR03437 family)